MPRYILTASSSVWGSRYEHGGATSVPKRKALKLIDSYFNELCTSNENMGLPVVEEEIVEEDLVAIGQFRRMNNESNDVIELINSLNEDQMEVFNYVKQLIDNVYHPENEKVEQLMNNLSNEKKNYF